MTRYRFRGIFLLFLMGHTTACAATSWQAPNLTASPDGDLSVSGYIEMEQPDQVRITTEDRTQYLLYSPSVEGDEIVSSDGLSVPIADIVKLEIWDKDDGWSPFAVVGGILLGGLALVGLFVAVLIAGWSGS
jgi:hypothetical protein